MSEDSYLTIAHDGAGVIREKMSRFLAFAHPIATPEQAAEILQRYRNEYHDARHVCWAYMLGPEKDRWQANDNGEPSGTAGRPILGQINSLELTDVIVVVVRYFGGIKLGTPGLIAAYRAAAREALVDAGTLEKFRSVRAKVNFPYLVMNDVMKITKAPDIDTLDRQFDNLCTLVLEMRKSQAPKIIERLSKIDGLDLSIID